MAVGELSGVNIFGNLNAALAVVFAVVVDKIIIFDLQFQNRGEFIIHRLHRNHPAKVELKAIHEHPIGLQKLPYFVYGGLQDLLDIEGLPHFASDFGNQPLALNPQLQLLLQLHSGDGSFNGQLEAFGSNLTFDQIVLSTRSHGLNGDGFRRQSRWSQSPGRAAVTLC